MDIFHEKIKFEQLLIEYKIKPLTVAYHGSIFTNSKKSSDIDVVLIVRAIKPQILRKISKINKQLKVHLGISILSAREAGTIFGGLKYLDALCRNIGCEDCYPYGYYDIATLNESFRRSAIEMNLGKCVNIGRIITKIINNLLKSNLSLNIKNFDSLVISLEQNLNFFYDNEKIKVDRYKENVRVIKK